MKSGEVAAAANVNPETLRYYERRGLLVAPARSAAGYRAYPPETVGVVRFIKRAQELGFTLADVEELLDLAAGGPEGCDGVRTLALTRLTDLEGRIADLRSMRDALSRLVDTCDMPRAERECPILAEIEQRITT